MRTNAHLHCPPHKPVPSAFSVTVLLLLRPVTEIENEQMGCKAGDGDGGRGIGGPGTGGGGRGIGGGGRRMLAALIGDGRGATEF